MAIEANTVICYLCNKRWNCKRYNICSRCRHGAKTPCPDCDGLKTAAAKRCRACSIKFSRGENSSNWSGGRVESVDGYVKVFNKEHPRRINDRYVLEHILVMEEHLGRFLVEGENVHHKNGVRSDNRLSNLELWSRSQPPGQRVIDRTIWAIEWLIERCELGDFPLKYKDLLVSMSDNLLADNKSVDLEFVGPAAERKTRRKYDLYNESKTLGAWARDDRCAVGESVLRRRMNMGWELESALSTELKPSVVPFEVAKGIVQSMSIKDSGDYSVRYTESKEYLPSNPSKIYKEEWVSWYDFLGKDRSHRIEWPTYRQASEIVRGMHIKTRREYAKKYKNASVKLPSAPHVTYKDEWISWGDFLGVGTQKGSAS